MTPNLVTMLSKIQTAENHDYVYHCTAQALIDAENVRTPFPPLFHVLCFVSYSMPRVQQQQSYRRAHRLLQAYQLAPWRFCKVRQTQMTVEHARQWRERRSHNNTMTCHPPLPVLASTPAIATTRMGNLMIVNTTLQVCEVWNATRCSMQQHQLTPPNETLEEENNEAWMQSTMLSSCKGC